MRGATFLYEGEITEAWARPRSGWRRRRASMLLLELDDSGQLGLAAKRDVEAELARAGLAFGGPVLTLWSRRFHLYLCHAADGGLSALRLVDGHGVAHLAPASAHGGMVRLQSGRSGETSHTLNLRPPGETLQVVIDVAAAGRGFEYAATFLARRRPAGRWSAWRAAAARLGGLSQRLGEVMACCETARPQAELRRLAA